MKAMKTENLTEVLLHLIFQLYQILLLKLIFRRKSKKSFPQYQPEIWQLKRVAITDPSQAVFRSQQQRCKILQYYEGFIPRSPRSRISIPWCGQQVLDQGLAVLLTSLLSLDGRPWNLLTSHLELVLYDQLPCRFVVLLLTCTVERVKVSIGVVTC